MARKDTLVYKLSTAKSLATSFTSPITLIKNLDNISYQINITTSDSTGTFAVQGSNDYAVSEPTNVVTNTGTWVPLTLGGTGSPSAAGANDSILIDLNQLSFNALRVAYTAGTAGTGTCDITLVARQVGG